MNYILITGAAGFVGMHLAKRLLSEGFYVVGVDSLNDYYDPFLKRKRISNIDEKCFDFYGFDLVDGEAVEALFLKYHFSVVINLAAQAGVRYSVEQPEAYLNSNLIGFFNILNACRKYSVSKLIYASSSSVYGDGDGEHNSFAEVDETSLPLSFYAATKKSNELMAYSYSSVYGLPTVGLRFFSVYGSWGRPDMAYFKFANMIARGVTIDVYNNGDMWRDFTHISDVVESIYRLCILQQDAKASVFNIGCGRPVRLGDMISLIERGLNRQALIRYLPKPAADAVFTSADSTRLFDAIGYRPLVVLSDGMSEFLSWYFDFYGVESGLN